MERARGDVDRAAEIKLWKEETLNKLNFVIKRLRSSFQAKLFQHHYHEREVGGFDSVNEGNI